MSRRQTAERFTCGIFGLRLAPNASSARVRNINWNDQVVLRLELDLLAATNCCRELFNSMWLKQQLN